MSRLHHVPGSTHTQNRVSAEEKVDSESDTKQSASWPPLSTGSNCTYDAVKGTGSHSAESACIQKPLSIEYSTDNTNLFTGQLQ